MELLHPAAGMEAQSVRAVRALGEAQAVPEGHRGVFACRVAARDRAQGFPLGIPGQGSGPQAPDAAQAGEPRGRVRPIRPGLIVRPAFWPSGTRAPRRTATEAVQ
jgi:hypothetical protein